MKSLDLPDKNCILHLVEDMFRETNDILWYYDLRSGIFRVSDKLKKLCELDNEFCIDSIEKLFSIIAKRDQKSLRTALEDLYLGRVHDINTEIRLVCGQNKLKSFLLKGERDSSVLNEAMGASVVTGTITDLQEARKRDARLNHAIYYDSLTGLVNRQMFSYKTNSYINYGINSLDSIAVIYISIDNFKQAIDLYGHMVGDEIIREVGKRISIVLDVDNILSRPGGEEFLILLQDNDQERLLKKVTRIQASIHKKLCIDGIEILLDTSAGIARYPEDGSSAEELIMNSHTAMHKAKEQGKKKPCFYDKNIKDEMLKRLELERNLRNALQNREFFLVYQPQVDIDTGLITGMEALIRWRSPIYGLVPPMEFIPVAERTGIIFQIGSWVLEEACRQCKKWIDSYGVSFSVSVNISALQLKNEDFFEAVLSAIEKSGLPEIQLQLEITESILLEDFERSVMQLEKIRQRGVKIALDDFGTGFSSLNYLKNLPLDTLKIDKSFVQGISDDEREKAITGTIVDLAHILELDVIAEGVETWEEAELLREMNCNHMQGYYFGRPQAPESLEAIFIKESEMYGKSACC